MLTNTKENIDLYTKKYLADDYEKINVTYRRQKVLEVLNTHKPRHILEVGCGTESLFEFYGNFDSFTVVEPSEEFCTAVKKSPKYAQNVRVINGFFGADDVTRQLGGVRLYSDE